MRKVIVQKNQGMSSPLLIFHFVKDVFPEVKASLGKWEKRAQSCPDLNLRREALSSIKTKRFHCLGGCFFALYPNVPTGEVIDFIVAYQTISDYLDNLVDSLGIYNEEAFQQLHLAMTEALDGEGKCSDYYAFYPYNQDGGYLESLVRFCQRSVASLPAYEMVKTSMVQFAKWYSLLQVTKHLDPELREEKISNWVAQEKNRYPEISQWEFAAASGSTLEIFALFALAYNPHLTTQAVVEHNRAYFPWIAGLHILLDYLIDRKEDRETGQLNFVEYYPNNEIATERLILFLLKSKERAKALPYSHFHETLIKGLLAMYLSDPKGLSEECFPITKALLKEGGINVQILYQICRVLRKIDIL